MARQCTLPKKPRNATWFKEKFMLAEAQEAGQIFDEEQLAFLADPGISEAPVAQQTIFPTGKDNVIVSAGSTKVIPAGSTILVLVVLCLLRVDSIVS
ncbi:hypothetical protein Tco_0021272 [Tanacetum coccineum]